MELFIDILILLAIIVGSVIVHRFLPAVPLPLLQVVLGCLAALSPFGIHVPLNPELFLVLFVAPLLYHDGRKTPRDELWKLKAPILLLALGLVFATVFIAGYGIHGLIPSIPLPAAFALAAILSPTDAVAVGAISRRVHLPKSILRLLEGEALINDASGMVAFKFAIAAMLTGVFSLSAASLSFVWMAIGGTVCGAALSFLIIRLRVLIRRLGVEEATLQTLLQIVTPFFIYLTAEELHVSGILAVVAGGIVHAIEQERAESSMLKLQIVSASTWSVILLMLNGLVFIMLGLHIPVVTAVIVESGAFDISRVLLYVAVLSTGLFALRFLWIYAGWTGAWLLGSRNKITKPQLKPALLTALSGVRGAITLAAAFSIPYTLQDGSPFPQRDLIIFYGGRGYRIHDGNRKLCAAGAHEDRRRRCRSGARGDRTSGRHSNPPGDDPSDPRGTVGLQRSGCAIGHLRRTGAQSASGVGNPAYRHSGRARGGGQLISERTHFPGDGL